MCKRQAREWATAEALLPLVLERGYQGCPDMTELSKKLARLYGAALSVDGTMSGQSRVLTVSLAGIRDAFALAGEPLSREYADIACGTAFEPYRGDGVLDAEAVAIEKEQLRELLEGEINEKRSYCTVSYTHLGSCQLGHRYGGQLLPHDLPLRRVIIQKYQAVGQDIDCLLYTSRCV